MNRSTGWIMSAALLALSAPGIASAALVSFSPSSGTLGVGGTTSVDVVISGLGAGSAPSVGTFDIDVSFDSSVLSASGVTFGTGLDVLGLGSDQLISIDNVAGTVNAYEVSLDSADDLDALQPDTFTLFTLTFAGLSAGTSTLELMINALGDASGTALAADVSGGELTVTAVPEPAATWLLLSGLAGLGIVGRRRKAA